MNFDQLIANMSPEDYTALIAGYANIVTFIAEQDMNIWDADDVKDAIVETHLDHLTDEMIDQGYEEFEAIRAVMHPNND